MGRLVIRDLWEMRNKGYDLRLHCRKCQRAIALDRHEIHLWAKVLGWSRDFDDLARRFPCRDCGNARIEWGFIEKGHAMPVVNFAAVARARRDHFLAHARFWHDISCGRKPDRHRPRSRTHSQPKG